MSNRSKSDRESAVARLRETIDLKPGDTVHTILRHVSRSGMSRRIGLVVLRTADDGRLVDFHPNISAAEALGLRTDRDGEGIIVGGCGMDMGFHLVYSLSRVLFPEGFGCIGEGCPSNDHSNGDRDYTPNEDRSGACGGCKGHVGEEPCESPSAHQTHWHRDGGYALRHRWL